MKPEVEDTHVKHYMLACRKKLTTFRYVQSNHLDTEEKHAYMCNHIIFNYVLVHKNIIIKFYNMLCKNVENP